MKVVAMVQARLKSERMPNKVLKQIKGQSIVKLIAERLKLSKEINEIVFVIPTDDILLFNEITKAGYNCYCGPEKDVLKRFYDANKQYHGDHVVRITADCPLIDPIIIDHVISEHKKNSNDFTTNSWIGCETYPDGLDVAVMKGQILSRLNAEASEPKDREHVWTYILDNKQRFKTQIIQSDVKLPNIRLTLDYEADFCVIEGVYREFTDNRFTFSDILKLYEKKPEIFEANKQYIRNESYIKQAIEEPKRRGRPAVK